MSRVKWQPLFRSEGESGSWQTFSAEGFENPVCGCIYKGGTIDNGLPLGGLGTGYVTLESSGELGKCSIFNEYLTPHTLNRPFLAVNQRNELHIISLTPPEGTKGASDIQYWGHFPVADLQVTLDIPLCLAIRAFTPFVLGDANTSNTPVVLLQVSLLNTGHDSVQGHLLFSFPGPEKVEESQVATPEIQFEHQTLKGKFSGVAVTQERGTGYALAVDLKDGVQHGAAFGTEGNPWSNFLDSEIKPADITDPGASLVVPYILRPGEEKRLRFSLGWFYPYFKDTSGEPHKHHYLQRFKSATGAVEYALSNFDSLLKRTLAWQRVIYNSELPIWLKDGLINSLYSLAKNTLWVVNDRPDNWYPEEGFFTHNESFTGCPITETMVCRMHGHFPTLFFFPELERTTLYAFKHFQINDGEIPFAFGTGSSLRDPRFHCQHPLNSGQYVQMLYHYWLRTGHHQFLEEFYESAKKAVHYQQKLDSDKDGLVNEHSHAEPGETWPANQFYDIWPWYGTSAYVAGTWLATLKCAEEMAKIMKDESFLRECQQWLERGQLSYEEKLWNGKYYRLYNDPQKERISEVCLANQLMGQWCIHLVGAENILPQDHITSALESIERLNFAATRYGLVNGMNPDGTPASCGDTSENDHGKQIFFAESICVAMTLIYNGRRELGLEIAKRLYEAMTIHHHTPWNQRCLIHAKDGSPVWGDDYYSNMIIWALPMALAKQNIKEFCQPGGLIDRLLKTTAEQ